MANSRYYILGNDRYIKMSLIFLRDQKKIRRSETQADSNRYNPCFIVHFMSLSINWDEIIKKEARGIEDYDLGEVAEVEGETVVTKKGILDKDKFYLPKSFVEAYDGHNLRFRITKEEAQRYRRD